MYVHMAGGLEVCLYVSCFHVMDLWTAFCKAKLDGTCSEASPACFKKNALKYLNFSTLCLDPASCSTVSEDFDLYLAAAKAKMQSGQRQQVHVLVLGAALCDASGSHRSCQPCQAVRGGTRGTAGGQAGFLWRKSWALGVGDLVFVREEPPPGSAGGRAEVCWWVGQGCSVCHRCAVGARERCAETSNASRLYIIAIYLFIISSQVPKGTRVLQLMDKGERWVWNRTAAEHHKFMFKEQTFFLSFCLSPPAAGGRTER